MSAGPPKTGALAAPAPPHHFDRDYRELATLADGQTALIRLVRPDDKDMFVRGLEHLSEESRYLRFFTSKRRFTRAELAYLTEVDQERHFALGALRVLEDGREEGLGVARFIAFPDDPKLAEAAVAVIDEIQGKGLGRLLFLRLVAAARERGITRFRAEVLPQNTAMRQLVHALDPEASEQDDGDCIVLTLSLPEIEATDPPSTDLGRGPMYRLMRLVAERLVTIRRAIDQRLLHKDEHDRPADHKEADQS